MPTPRAQARDTLNAREDYRHNLEEWAGHYAAGSIDSLLPTTSVLDKDFDATGTGQARQANGKQMHLAHALGLTLLPTPAVNDMGEGKTPEAWDDWTGEQKAKHGNGNGHGPSLAIEAQRVLPTPTSWEQRSDPDKDPRNLLPLAVQRMLPTPKATNNENEPSEGFGSGGVGWALKTTPWGQYAAAVARWERILGRPAPEPTTPGRNGEPRLNPALTEWMMGLPAGHICDVPGLSRQAQLKAAGNGVVPQQAEYALRLMVTDLHTHLEVLAPAA